MVIGRVRGNATAGLNHRSNFNETVTLNNKPKWGTKLG